MIDMVLKLQLSSQVAEYSAATDAAVFLSASAPFPLKDCPSNKYVDNLVAVVQTSSLQ